MSDAATVTSTALSGAQLKATLWGAADARVYAIVIGSRVPGLVARLEQAESAGELADLDCLWPGALDPAQRDVAPYLLQLKAESPLTDWLLFEAAAGLGPWGVLMISPATQLPLRTHCRQLCKAALSDGQVIDLAWYEPEVLRALLGSAGPDQLAQWFAVPQALLLPHAKGWNRYLHSYGQMQQQQLQLLA